MKSWTGSKPGPVLGWHAWLWPALSLIGLKFYGLGIIWLKYLFACFPKDLPHFRIVWAIRMAAQRVCKNSYFLWRISRNLFNFHLLYTYLYICTPFFYQYTQICTNGAHGIPPHSVLPHIGCLWDLLSSGNGSVLYVLRKGGQGAIGSDKIILQSPIFLITTFETKQPLGLKQISLNGLASHIRSTIFSKCEAQGCEWLL